MPPPLRPLFAAALALLVPAGCGETDSPRPAGGGGSGGTQATGGSAGAEAPAACLDEEIAFSPSSALGVLDWSKFPHFELPPGLIAVWDGPHFDSLAREPLQHGFTHLQQGGAPTAALFDLPVESRALLWTGIALIDGQPWTDVQSPWGNDLAAFQAKWAGYWKAYANYYSDSVGQPVPRADLVAADIESHRETPEDILALRAHPSTPPEIAALDDDALIDRYRRDMAKLYDVPLAALRAAGYQGRISSYADAPVRRVFWEIPMHSWKDWQSDRSLTSYLVADPSIAGSAWKQSYGAFYQHQDVLTPSAYFFYDYPASPAADPSAWERAARWLAYLLFQIEANRAWSSKDSIVFEWMDYHTSANPPSTRIRPFMAEAAAVFPFLAGARGVWLWSAEPSPSGSSDLSYAPYEWFVHGLYRLSRCRAFFEGEHSFWAPDDPVALYSESKPVIRGVIRGSRLLVAVQNPFAAAAEPSSVDVVFQGTKLATVELTGPELWLGVLDLTPKR